ncbi:AraC family transcriptional regulator [Pseudohalioglobus lutimaris]|uniref:AraC family transcriptional regulator n=1 Tax=Pseudohalioglobus lutimaris TaxID=1737061 RepID=A0A2N5X425_9GAMM|nr:AraC family transcriptional regulator [Pseudohalioglobus lutimaris]PLW69244.1 AraC family transcriptional regulator [Pseudohalioglobus lutimaris]
MGSKSDTSHHIKALPTALRAMSAMGFDPAECLTGTGLRQRDLENSKDIPFTLEQEFRFHRNLLALTDNPMLGLLLGREYQLESYGLLGYAFMSAPTLRQAMIVIRNYGPLTFTLFDVSFLVESGRGKLRFSPDIAIPPDLLTYYVDRDLTAAVSGGHNAVRQPLQPIQIQLMHSGDHQRELYERHFSCPVTFSAPASELQIDAAVLDETLPMGDSETSAMCQQQCRLLLARMRAGSTYVDKVRQLIVARPGYFPDIDYVAEKLNMTSRTLRRKLCREGSCYQDILAEVRYQLAQEYLATSTLPLEEISILLGYSAPGNFSNAFKRWHGSSPRDFRRMERGTPGL